jgi:hypothetical protein
MSKRSRHLQLCVSFTVLGVILIPSILNTFTYPVAAETPIVAPVLGSAATATYSDANQPNLVIHTTSNSISTAEPSSHPVKTDTSGSDSEQSHALQSTQELPSTHSPTQLSGYELPNN